MDILMDFYNWLYREVITHGHIIPIFCMLLAFSYKKIICRKIPHNKFRHLIPLMSIFIGVIIMFTCTYWIQPDIKMWCCQLLLGVIYGAAAVGYCETYKHTKRFFKELKLQKEIDKK